MILGLIQTVTLMSLKQFPKLHFLICLFNDFALLGYLLVCLTTEDSTNVFSENNVNKYSSFQYHLGLSIGEFDRC